MSIATLLLGESGTGKTASLRNLDPKKTLLIQPVRKPLPFRAKGWREGKGGNIYVSDDPQKILDVMRRAPDHFEIIVCDDFQYILANMYMKARDVKGFDKFTAIGGAGFDIAKAASELGMNKRVYVLAHTTTDEYGNTRIKTLGKLLDDKIVVEGLFTTVLRTVVDGGKYFYSTHNNGHDTVKSPMGMFEEDRIENDVALIDQKICEYYAINEPDEIPDGTTPEAPAPITQHPVKEAQIESSYL